MVIDDLDVMGIARAETEHHPPRAIDGDGPAACPISTQFMQPNATQVGQVVQGLRCIQLAQTQTRFLFVQT